MFNIDMEVPTNQEFLKALVSNFLRGKSILVIDDEEEILKVIENYLIKSEIEKEKIISVLSSEEALEKIKSNKIGLIIIDIHMPNVSGFDFIENIKKDDNLKNIPIIISSGNVNGQNLQNAILLGIKNIIIKPFSYNLFVDRLCKALIMSF